MTPQHYIDPWNGRHRNKRCTAGRCRSWAIVKYSVDNSLAPGGFMVIGYYCRAHIEPTAKAYPEDNKQQPVKEKS